MERCTGLLSPSRAAVAAVGWGALVRGAAAGDWGDLAVLGEAG